MLYYNIVLIFFFLYPFIYVSQHVERIMYIQISAIEIFLFIYLIIYLFNYLFIYLFIYNELSDCPGMTNSLQSLIDDCLKINLYFCRHQTC